MKSKSLFSSVTVWGAILSCWLALSPNVKIGLENGFTPSVLIDMMDNIIVTIVTIIGRYNADSIVYTPKYFLGRNQQEND